MRKTIEVDDKVWKKLQKFKLKFEVPTLNAVISYLIDFEKVAIRAMEDADKNIVDKILK